MADTNVNQRAQRGWMERLMTIDRRVIFLLLGASVAIPIIFSVDLPIAVSPPVESLFEFLETDEGLNSGQQALLISMDFAADTEPELFPMTMALLRHAFSRDIPVLVMTLQAPGAGLAELAVSQAAEDYGKESGTDYVYLGFRPGMAAVMLGLGTSVRETFPEDYYGTPASEIPLLERIHNYNDIALVVSISSSSIPESWVSYAGSRYGQRVASGVTAVMAADMYPWLQTGQMIGLLGGLKGAAEYEDLLDKTPIEQELDEIRRVEWDEERYHEYELNRRRARIGMGSQSLAHMLIIFLIVIGNVAFLAERRKSP
jgi:hypothetical protein